MTAEHRLVKRTSSMRTSSTRTKRSLVPDRVFLFCFSQITSFPYIKVDSMLQDRDTRERPHVSTPDVTEKRREERSSVEEYRRVQKERSELAESPRATSERRETAQRRPSPIRTSRDMDYTTDYQKYEKETYAPPSRSVSITRSSHTASDRSPRYQHRKISREHEESLRQERKTMRDIPIRREIGHRPYHYDAPHLRQRVVEKPRPYVGRLSCDGRYVSHPIHEVITTEKFERVEKIRRLPGTLV
ncbi:hypothetical protein KIN20_015740 [Parelaphostrongylus tenuis]|uniref:Uncharacterized protein n=1 Tax=Parelaphostrongylus tenuis TaxID=148309 RepID=A0AAD5QSN7_PARTN|nr:hypothetical protein KIN20_015740 [Parelaphostrongylus tenuis]